MDYALSFDDVLIKPRFSEIVSRQNVNVNSNLFDWSFFPVISANMDTITEVAMAQAMDESHGLGCLHRFCSIENNVKMFKQSPKDTFVSIGLGNKELERAEALYSAGAITFVIDVAHGASLETVKQVEQMRSLFGFNIKLVAGNFATYRSIQDLRYHSAGNHHEPDAFKVGIGGGSACTTRVVTGCGMPTLASLLDCSKSNVPLIADGGMRTSGDIAKALAVPNVQAVMLGGMLAGTNETPGQFESHPISSNRDVGQLLKTGQQNLVVKKYRGSASQESYAIQNKIAEWRTAEGESFLVPYKGPVKNVLQQIDAGLRSAFSYVGATDLKDFQENAEFVQISSNGVKENGAHGKS